MNPGVALLAATFLLAFPSLCGPMQKKGKSQKPSPAVIEVLQVTSSRSDGKVQIDGKIRNSGERPAEKVHLFFDFLAAGNAAISSAGAEIDPETLGPGEEAEFHLEVPDPIRAVRFTMRVEESDGRELKIVKPGPYGIE